MAAAPAPEKTTLIFSIFFPTHSRALRSAAPEMIAVPCWSSWKTGIFIGLPQRLLDVETVRGADVLEIDSADRWLEQLAEPDHIFRRLGADLEIEDIEIGELLEEVAFPSITGLPASAPMLPSPSTAVPLVTTATRLPLAVYW